MALDALQIYLSKNTAEMTMVRQLLIALCRQASDPAALLADFDQGVEEARHIDQVRNKVEDPFFEDAARQFRILIASGADSQKP